MLPAHCGFHLSLVLGHRFLPSLFQQEDMAGGYDRVSAGWRTGVWTAALTVMGAACIANAARCGRTHCYVTGPFFLLMALGSFLYGVGVVPLGANGWNLIGLAILFGAIVLCCLPELLFGKYRRP